MKRWHHCREKPNPKLGVVIAVYNKPKELALCLEAYKRQSFLIDCPGELQIILADDGSGPEIEDLFSKFSGEVPFSTAFIRQEDRGWGKLRMLNWAVLECKADRIIFTDGDCVPHRHFLKCHYEDTDSRTVACGRRVDIMEDLAKRISMDDISQGNLESPAWLLRFIFKGKSWIEYGGQGFYFPQKIAKIFSAFSTNPVPTLLGSNFSVNKKWLIEMNGFDETFDVPGMGEDTDMERRFHLMGLKLEWITYRAIQFHIWHPLTHVGQKAHGTYESLKQKGERTARKGIQEFLPLYRKILPG